MKRPIILVTGANAGLGLGLCKRLLVQLSSPSPPDSAALDTPRRDPAGTPFDARDGCTLVLACRNQAKAVDAKLQLQELLSQISHSEDEIIQSNRSPDTWPDASSSSVNDRKSLRKREYETKLDAPLDVRNRDARMEYRQSFCAGTKIEIVPLDLSSVASTKECARMVASKFPYLTHLILNAGGASWVGINWIRATWEILTNLHKAVTFPSYKLQRSGEVSKDGFGWVWQINVGGHYLLAHELDSLLRASPYATPSRIIWTGSLEANPNDFHANDFQCLDPKISPNPYESTKYQCELASLAMDERFLSLEQSPALRSFTAHPGIVATSIFSGVIPAIMARWTFSPHHPIDAYKGAVAASFVAVAPAEYLDGNARYGAQATWTGHEYAHAGRLLGWQDGADGIPDPRILSTARDLIASYDRVLNV